jgi:demethylmenaquinone methyltransferase/2-methoxy-6-polyprenyl-1,4-benzoquinol methylase
MALGTSADSPRNGRARDCVALPLPLGSEKRAAVRSMFERIAPRYDALNRLLSLGLDQRWRRRALDLVGVGPSDLVLDIATGTGDLAALAAARGARVIGLDFTRGMLRGAQRRRVRAAFLQADADVLPLPDGLATVVTCGFSLRNFVSIPNVLGEMGRILASGGRLALLDVDVPKHALVRAGHRLYFQTAVPRIGALFSDRAAYAYLPRSVSYLPPRDVLLDLVRKAGFEDVQHRPLLFGAAQLIVARRGAR